MKISKKTAKLAREAGINVTSRYAYNQDGELDDSRNFLDDANFTVDDIETAHENGYLCYLAPSLNKLQKVLRKKHKVEIGILIYNSGFSSREYKAYLFVYHDKIKCKELGTYEHVQELAIQKALKRIIKNNK